MAVTVLKDPKKVTRMLKAATQVFADDGYQRAKTDQIAIKAQVSKGLIFHYYGSKAGLYLAVVKAAMATITANVSQQALAVPPDLVTLVVQSTQAKAAFGQQYPNEFAVMMQAYGDAKKLPGPIQNQLMTMYQQAVQGLRQQFDQVLDQMSLRPDVDRELVLNLVVGVYNQLFAEFQAEQSQHTGMKTMSDADWIVARARAYMEILQSGFVKSLT